MFTVHSICVLTAEEAGRYEHYGYWPSCKAHRHVSAKEAEAMVLTDEWRIVGNTVETSLSAIMPCATNGRVWRGRPSGHPLGLRIMQLVKPV